MSNHEAPGAPRADATDDRATEIVPPGSSGSAPAAFTRDALATRGEQAESEHVATSARVGTDAWSATVTLPRPLDLQAHDGPAALDDTAMIATQRPTAQASPAAAAGEQQTASEGGFLAPSEAPPPLSAGRAPLESALPPVTEAAPVPTSSSGSHARRGRRERRITRLLLLFGGSIFLIAYIIAAFAAGTGVPRGTTVLGVNIGGMSASAAIEKLEIELPSRLADEITLTAGEDRVPIRPSDAGLSIDYPATVAAAGSSSLNPFTLLGQLGDAEPVDPVVVVDDNAMAKTLDALADELAQEPREGAITFVDGAAEATAPQTGRELEKATTRRAMEVAYGTGRNSLDAAVRVIEPQIGTAELERAMTELAEPAVSGPITLDVEGRSIEIPVGTFATSLSMPAEDGWLTLAVDGDKLHADLRGRLDGIEVEPRDATFQIVGGRPEVVASQDGKAVPPEDLAAAVLAVLPNEDDRIAEVDLVVVKPDLTTGEANDLGVVEKVSSWTTTFDYAEYRAQNIGQAARYLNGALVLPGEEFSFNKRVGERTGERGFVKGIIISHGEFDEDWGGGVSAAATTTFNAIFYAGLKDVEHHPHSFWIPRYPKGTEATVAWGAKDLRFLNDSGRGIFIQASATNTSVTITFWSTKKYEITRVEGPEYNVKPYDTIEKDRCVPQSGMRGFDIDVWRVFKQDGREVRREKFKTHYIPADEIICEEVIRP